jgi:hypothetical protein
MASRPSLSLVVACSATEPHLEDFLRSAAAPDGAAVPDGVEVVLVVPEGSPSASVAAAWTSVDAGVRIVHSSTDDARNAGLAAASGTWVSFPSPRDELGPDYLTVLTGYLEDQADAVTVVMTHPIAPDGGASTDRLALPDRFNSGEPAIVVDLTDRPQYFPAHPETFVVRRAQLDGIGFEAAGARLAGAAVAARVLLRHEPVVALLPEAHYRTGRRSPDQGTEPSLVPPTDYDDHFGGTHLALLREARLAGRPPTWLQYLVIHDLATWFVIDRSRTSPTAALSVADCDRFLAWVTRILDQVDVAALEGFAASAMVHDVRAALLALRGAIGTPGALYLAATARHQGLVQLRCYHDASPLPLEYRVDGKAVQPVFHKIRGVTFFRRPVVNQTLAWIPAGKQYQATLAGVELEVRPARNNPWPTSARFPRPASAAATAPSKRRWTLRRVRERLVARVASSRLAGKYADCWLFVDRAVEAHDNAEHLYRHFARTRPEINSWFLLNRDSPDRPRLAKEGFRLLTPGSLSHTLALYNCRQVMTSQIIGATIAPPEFPGKRRWKVHFLRHGIAVDDLSRAYNGWQVDTLLSSTPAEYRSIAGDGSNYLHTARETVLTGLPRHDELLRKAAAVRDEERRQVLFLPTWRPWLLTRPSPSGRWRSAEGFARSAWAVHWSGLLNSQPASRLASAHGLEFVLMPHPNMPADGLGSLGPHVRLASYADHDIQQMLARAAIVVTDYSSLAFEAALIDRPLLYYQFDQAEFFGSKSGRAGYFDFERDGFGPVCTTPTEAENALAELIRAGLDLAEPYASRVAATFTVRDGRACERAAQAIIERSGKWSGWTAFAP